MAPKPSILIVPGSFTIAAMYFPLQDLLVSRGYEAFVNTLPSASRGAPELPATLSDDAEFFTQIIAKVADQGKDIIILAHSYGGLVASEASRDQSKSQRTARGQEGGIVRIIFLSAVVLKEGESLFGNQGRPPATVLQTDEYGFMQLANPAMSAARMYDTWPEERALTWTKAAPKQSALSFESVVKHTGYKHIPSSYIFCERDQVVATSLQLEYIDNIKEVTGQAVDVHRIDENHVPNLTAPELIVEIILKIALIS